MKTYNDYFGPYGGRYIAELLREPILDLEIAYKEAIEDSSFLKELDKILKEFVGRPTPLLHAENASKEIGGAEIYIKLEGLANTGAHKINNAVGQALLAKRMGKTRIIAETGAGQHGVATASACAKLGLDCVIYMGTEDIRRQRPNVFWMEMYGAEVRPVNTGACTLKDAVNEAFRDWSESYPDTHYLLGSALGPSPFPDMVRTFQSVIGKEVKEQADFNIDMIIACVGGGSNSIGIFSPFLEEKTPRLIGVEAGGRGAGIGNNAIRMTDTGVTGICQGYKSKFLLDKDGQVLKTHSISAGLDYPGIGPQLAWLGDQGRVEFSEALDTEVLDAMKFFARTEGVIFALESSHAGVEAIKQAKKLGKGHNIVINMSGRGDKDIFITAGELGGVEWRDYLRSEADRPLNEKA